MKAITLKAFAMLIGMCVLAPGLCMGSFFEMELKRDSIYTPGRMKLIMNMTDMATVRGKYSVRVSVFVSGSTVREKTLGISRDAPAVFELDFPQTRSRTQARCRAELLIDGRFIEAQERPLLLWPALSPLAKPIKDKVVWVFDTSGALQEIFETLEVDAGDATFQAVRDFQVPQIVFVGEHLGVKNFQLLTDRILSKDKNLETVVFLRQKEFPEDWPVQVTSVEKKDRDILCDVNSPLLSGLSKFDIMTMARKAGSVEIVAPKGRKWVVDSSVTEEKEDDKRICSYLAAFKEKKLQTVYCQLPVTAAFDNNPRAAVLLGNILQFVYGNNSEPDNR